MLQAFKFSVCRLQRDQVIQVLHDVCIETFFWCLLVLTNELIYMKFLKKIPWPISCMKLDDSGEGSLFFINNGSKLLEELIAHWDGRSKISLRNYSSKELSQATDNFSSQGVISEDSHYRIYKGSFEKREILIKKYLSSGGLDERESFAVRDIVVSSYISFHKNVMKLIGYCLDYKYPVLIYQSPESLEGHSRNLFYSEELKLTWEKKISIALDIANVLAYLHTGVQTPVIHRNLKLGHIVIDKYGTAKLTDFSLCITIPLGECQVEDDVVGTYGYADPEYVATGVLTEKSDVFNFGVVLTELLTGKRYLNIDQHGLHNRSIFDFLRSFIERDEVEVIVSGDMVMEGKVEQFRAFAALISKCTRKERDSRPEMVDIAKELRRIQRLACSLSTS